jgi:hypothetical protein
MIITLYQIITHKKDASNIVNKHCHTITMGPYRKPVSCAHLRMPGECGNCKNVRIYRTQSHLFYMIENISHDHAPFSIGVVHTYSDTRSCGNYLVSDVGFFTAVVTHDPNCHHNFDSWWLQKMYSLQRNTISKVDASVQ